MNIRIKNRRNLEFDLADLEVLIKDYIEEQGAIVSPNCPHNLFILYFLVVPNRSTHAFLNLDLKKAIQRLRQTAQAPGK